MLHIAIWYHITTFGLILWNRSLCAFALLTRLGNLRRLSQPTLVGESDYLNLPICPSVVGWVCVKEKRSRWNSNNNNNYKLLWVFESGKIISESIVLILWVEFRGEERRDVCSKSFSGIGLKQQVATDWVSITWEMKSFCTRMSDIPFEMYTDVLSPPVQWVFVHRSGRLKSLIDLIAPSPEILQHCSFKSSDVESNKQDPVNDFHLPRRVSRTAASKLWTQYAELQVLWSKAWKQVIQWRTTRSNSEILASHSFCKAVPIMLLNRNRLSQQAIYGIIP